MSPGADDDTPRGRLLGIDIGDATFGLALSDETWLIASSLTTLRRHKKLEDDLTALRSLVAEHEITRLVVGIPRKLDGRATEQTRKTERTAAALEAGLGLPVEREDETWTTAAARRTLTDAGARHHKKSGALDKTAAALILQLWLDRRRARLAFLGGGV